MSGDLMWWMAKLEMAKEELGPGDDETPTGRQIRKARDLIDTALIDMGAVSRHALQQTGFEAWAWIGEDEFRPGEIGFKQGIVPAGNIALVATQRSKVDRDSLRRQLQAQVDQWGKPVRLVRLVMVDEVDCIQPASGDQAPPA